MKKAVVKNNRVKSFKQRHLWGFSGGIAKVDADVEAGEIVKVTDESGNFLATAAYNKNSQIALRVWSFDELEVIDWNFFKKRIHSAVELRKKCGFTLDGKSGVRLVNSDGDFLSGVIADFYGGFVVLQILSAGAEKFKMEIAEILMQESQAVGVYERSDAKVREFEGLEKSCGLLLGKMPEKELIIEEDGVKFRVDIANGHKSGFYLDQRENRKIVSTFCHDKAVLNCFSYTGGFGLAALKNGQAASVVNVDSSQDALDAAALNLALNEIPEGRCENICADVFSLLRKFRAEKRTFDVIILDPPKLADSKPALIRAAKAYKDMALVAMQILNPGGFLINFSCSGHMDADLFQKVTFDAANDAEIPARLITKLQQSSDHVVNLAVPEGFYLKGQVVYCG